MRFLLVLFLIFFSIPVGYSNAQLSTSIIGEGVRIATEPQYPSPGETVTATLDDYSINSSGASISWYFDGTEIQNARDKRMITFSADPNGRRTDIEVRLAFTNKPAQNAIHTIKPVYLDLIVEPQTYTPVFYQGRALPVHGSLVNLTALAHTETGMVATANYSYNWQLNGNSIYGGPQKGNNRAQITIPYGLDSIVTVTVQDQSGTIITRRLVSVPSVPVQIEFYEVSTLYGLSHRAIGTTMNLIGNSSTIRAVPYYLDTRAVNSSLFSEWSINGRKNQTITNDPFEINLQRSGVGGAQISFKIRNLAELIQGDEASFQVKF